MIEQAFREAEQGIEGMEGRPLAEVLAGGLDIVQGLLIAYGRQAGKAMEEGDILKVFRAFVKGDPSLHAIRESVRELVFMQNCLRAGRLDLLPPNPEKMALRLTRHIMLYLRSRCETAGWLGQKKAP